jgi:hypothetical protein
MIGNIKQNLPTAPRSATSAHWQTPTLNIERQPREKKGVGEN